LIWPDFALETVPKPAPGKVKNPVTILPIYPEKVTFKRLVSRGSKGLMSSIHSPGLGLIHKPIHRPVDKPGFRCYGKFPSKFRQTSTNIDISVHFLLSPFCLGPTSGRIERHPLTKPPSQKGYEQTMNVSLTKAFVKAGNQTKIVAETKMTRQYC